jgi:hypothetical protein
MEAIAITGLAEAHGGKVFVTLKKLYSICNCACAAQIDGLFNLNYYFSIMPPGGQRPTLQQGLDKEVRSSLFE